MLFNIAPQLRGYLTPADLLKSEGTFQFAINREQLPVNGSIFEIEGDGFVFNLSFHLENLIVQRNNTVLQVELDKIPIKSKLLFFVMWSHKELKIHCSFGKKKEDKIISTLPYNSVPPPNSLLKWTRLNNLIPTKEYSNAEEFRTKIHSCLETINEKIGESDGFYPFWNIIYDKGKIVDRQPKNEIEIQPVMQCLLSDQMLASSIEIIPEFKSGIGNLDFLFIGQVKDRGAVYFCTEFKNAHSDKIFDGLTKQLPAYIKNKRADYGAYCVLNYFGEWLEASEKNKNIEFEIKKKRIFMEKPYCDIIRVFNFNLAKPISASKL
jgi:hypothetical protein